MSLKRLIAALGAAGSLGVAAPAFADWVQVPVPAPPGVIVESPGVELAYGRPGVYYRDGYDPGYWRFDHRRHEWRQWRDDDWRDHEWREHHKHHHWHEED